MLLKNFKNLNIVTNDIIDYATRRTIESGATAQDLMQDTAQRIVNAVKNHPSSSLKVDILCGPGNKGGIGFVVAQILKELKYRVRVFVYISPDKIFKKEAYDASVKYNEATQKLSDFHTDPEYLIIDALFGSNIHTNTESPYDELIKKINQGEKAGIISIDLPSGIQGDTGKIMGVAIKADQTIVFDRLRPAHLLFPGHGLCGNIVIVSTNIQEVFLSPSAEHFSYQLYVNEQRFFNHLIPSLDPCLHKYLRGYTLILSGGIKSTGAARLAARAAARVGAGIVKIGAPRDAIPIIANHETSIIPTDISDKTTLEKHLDDSRLGCLIAGPGLELNNRGAVIMQTIIDYICHKNLKAVLDADILTLIAMHKKDNYPNLNNNVLLTPHEEEYRRLFPEMNKKDKITKARHAAKIMNAVCLLKGPDTVIAAPDGRVSIQTKPCFNLATAGSGDLLAGIVGSLISRKMPIFEAACAAVIVHSEAGEKVTYGALSEDIVNFITPPIAYNHRYIF
jgi:NAD(P)H-hydrate epimerase